MSTAACRLLAGMPRQTCDGSVADAACLHDSEEVYQNGGALPSVHGGCLRALTGDQVFLHEDGSVTGASLWLSRHPPRVTREFVHTFSVQAPWAFPQSAGAVEAADSHAPDACLSPQGECEDPSARAPTDCGDVTAQVVLSKISSLMNEMTCMESSLAHLRQEMDQEQSADDATDENGGAFVRSARDTRSQTAARNKPQGTLHTTSGDSRSRTLRRLRARLPEALKWLESKCGRQPLRAVPGRSLARTGRSPARSAVQQNLSVRTNPPARSAVR